MYDSGISAAELINQLQIEADIAIEISNAAYVFELNSLEQLLYTEIIREQRSVSVTPPTNNIIDMSTISALKGTGENDIRFEDIYTVYAHTPEQSSETLSIANQLIKTNLASSDIFPNTWYNSGGKLGIHTDFTPTKIEIIYFVKPALKTVNASDEVQSGNVSIPYEFIGLIKAKLRGEMYKAVNEDGIAGKWLNDYNVQLENFKAWCQSRQAQFGC